MLENRALVAVLFLLSLLVFRDIPAQAQAPVDRIYVLGAVNNPGGFEHKAGMTAKDAVRLAKGVSHNADTSRLLLVRASGDKEELGLDDVLQDKFKVGLDPGDTLVVKPAAVEESPSAVAVSITGNIPRPGTYTLISGRTDTLDGLFALAGGCAPSADLTAIRITSGKGETHCVLIVDASTFQKRGSIRLAPGDWVFVPQIVKPAARKTNLNNFYQATVVIATLLSLFKR